MESGTTPLLLLVVVGMVLETAWGHGMMLRPAQRSSLWRNETRYPGVETNYDDNALFCGGYQRQWDTNGGKCGICGDPYNVPEPRPNEAGGKYGRGVIAEMYTQGEFIDVLIRITANHKGYFVFKLCPHNDVNTEASQHCLDQNVLKTVDPSTGNLVDKFSIGTFAGDKQIRLKLPSDVTCTQCVLQWTYNTGNSFNCFDNKTCCVGCGPQENFVNCADITITAPGVTGTATNAPTTTDYPTTTGPSAPFLASRPAPTTTNQPTTQDPSTTTATTTTTTTAATTTTTTTASPGQARVRCLATGAFVRVPGMTRWCVNNCAAGFCPPSHCRCS